MRAAVISSAGMGDGLLMMIASHRLLQAEHEVLSFHNQLHELASWFPGHRFKKRPSPATAEEELLPFDLIVLQNDHSPLALQVIDLHRKGKVRNLAIFYSSYEKNKHPPLTSWDRTFNRKEPMAENIAKAIASILQLKQISKNNGLIPPQGLVHQKYPQRIVIHPTSTSPKRTWKKKKFIQVATFLKKEGYEVVFSVSPQEREDWLFVIELGFALPFFPTLSDLAGFLYESGFFVGNESGTGHLASNLYIPTLVAAGCRKQIALWRPGWLPGKVATPHPLIPNIKKMRLRERKWQFFLTTRHLLKQFHLLLQEEHKGPFLL